MERVLVQASTPYCVCIGRGILGGLPGLLGESAASRLDPSDPALVVSDRNAARLYLEGVAGGLEGAGLVVRKAVFRGGERLKSARPLTALLGSMARAGLTRDSLVFALGGGVVGDFAGFAASVYMRGCGLVQIPTTLLAQVDSSVGGKVGIDLREGKNLAGSFHNPLLVVCDTATLETLPAREIVSGLAEVVKYGLIRDRELFGTVEGALTGARRGRDGRFEPSSVKGAILGDEDLIRSLVRRSVGIKSEIVGVDERESGLRMILNFGHTFGHAVEQLTGYRRFLHGEAVVLGMKMAAALSADLGMLEASESDRVSGVLDLFRVPSPGRRHASDIFAQMGRDKKKRGGELHLVLLEGIGRGKIVRGVDEGKTLRCIEKVLERERGR